MKIDKNYIVPNWPAPKNIYAYTTARDIGNLAVYVGDDVEQVLKSRERIKLELRLPSEPYWLKQEHTTNVIEVNSKLLAPIADAAFTRQRNVVCAVLTADCLPILVCDKKGQIVAAIHAGWRGLAFDIIENTLQRLLSLVEAKDLIVWFGPAISSKAFIVGEEVRQVFIDRDKNASKAFTYFADKKWYADIYFLARQRLNNLGVTDIYGGDYCTYTNTDLFFSYRREKEKAGRIASLIWMI